MCSSRKTRRQMSKPIKYWHPFPEPCVLMCGFFSFLSLFRVVRCVTYWKNSPNNPLIYQILPEIRQKNAGFVPVFLLWVQKSLRKLSKANFWCFSKWICFSMAAPSSCSKTGNFVGNSISVRGGIATGKESITEQSHWLSAPKIKILRFVRFFKRKTAMAEV